VRHHPADARCLMPRCGVRHPSGVDPRRGVEPRGASGSAQICQGCARTARRFAVLAHRSHRSPLRGLSTPWARPPALANHRMGGWSQVTTLQGVLGSSGVEAFYGLRDAAAGCGGVRTRTGPGHREFLLHNKLHNAGIGSSEYVAVNTCITVTCVDYWLDFIPVVLKPLKLVRLPVPPLPRQR
jgi:hypothetical protein